MQKRSFIVAALLFALSGAGAPAFAQNTCMPMEYRVFFNWNSTEMPAEAEEVVTALLDSSRTRAATGCRIRTITVTGHVDTSEIAIGAGERLSTARARGIADIFIRVGAPRNIVNARGAPQELFRPTAPDVREPMNRNAAITITFN